MRRGAESRATFHLAHAESVCPEFARALVSIVNSYPRVRKIHLVMDNLDIHCQKTLTDFFGAELRCRPLEALEGSLRAEAGSWLNQAEIEISLFSRQCPGRRRIPTLRILRQESRAWNRKVNQAEVRIHRQFTRKQARANFGYKRNLLRRSKT